MDFALWKRQGGRAGVALALGHGAAGVAYRCSVMANAFSATIDIHSGGQDLIFPHHENEIAQSEAANGVPFARFWLHNGYINVDNQKMSKSKGNFFTVREAAKAFGYDAIRFFMLSAHYRSPINYSTDILEQAAAGLSRIRNCLENLEFLSASARQDEREADRAFIDRLPSFREAFIERLTTISTRPTPWPSSSIWCAKPTLTPRPTRRPPASVPPSPCSASCAA